MRQIMTVRQTFSDQTAEVFCRRETACGHACTDCGMCPGAEMAVRARNPLGAAPGDSVWVETETGPVLGAAAVVYLVPLALLAAGYGLLGGWGAAGGFALGLAPAFLLDRRLAQKREMMYRICGYAVSERPYKEDSLD